MNSKRVNRKSKIVNGPVHFANSHLPIHVISFGNAASVTPDGWAQLAPFGDFPGHAMVQQPDGSTKTYPAVQRMDRAAADSMVARFKSPWNRVKRYFTGCPIYAGHPDAPAFANEHTDRTPKGMIVDLQVRDDGLFCKPVFTNEGSDLVETKKFRAFSAFWSAREIGEQPGADGHPRKVYRPDVLKSAGLTNHPNLPVHLLNETQTQQEPQTEPIVKKQIVIDFLAARGITVPTEATDDQVAEALHSFGDRVANTETELANERQFHRDTLLDHALTAGRITPAQRLDWSARLEADFANASVALAQLAPALKTTALTANLGARKAEIANISERRDALDTLIKAEMQRNGGDYDRAFAAVRKANPALFSAMKQPTTN